MHSIKGIFKHKSKSEGFLLNDSSISDDEGKENKKKSKEIKKNESRKSNNNILKNLSRHSSRISNIGLENESTDKLKEKAITNDVNLLNDNDVNGNNIPNENVDSKDHKISHKKLPTIRTLKEIGASTSMPVISPSRKDPNFSEDEEQITRQKSKKELKKEFKIEEKKKKKELKEQKKKEKKERKKQKNLEKGEFYALNSDKKRKEIKKEYKKMKKNKNNIFDMNKSSESLSPSLNVDDNSPRNLDDNENKEDNNKKKIKDNINENENDENVKEKGKEIEEEEKEEIVREKEYEKIKMEELKEKPNENENKNEKEKENKKVNENENENENEKPNKNKNKNENENKNENKKENKNENENDKSLNVQDEKKKQEIEKIEDELPLAILRYKNPQYDKFNRMRNTNDDEDEDKPLYEVKLRYSNRRSMLNGNEMRKSVSTSDLLSRVRRSMALRNSTYFNTGESTAINRANIPQVQSLNILQPISDDDEDELSLAALKQKRASVLNPTAEPNNNNHTIYSNNRNTFSNSALKNSFSTGYLNINNPTIHNSLMVGQMNGMMMNGAPMNNSPLNGIPITGMVKNGIPISGSLLNTVPGNMLRASPGHSPINSPLLRSNEVGGKRPSIMSNNGIKNSRSSMNFAEYNKAFNEQELQRKRQSIIESNKRRSQIMMNNYIPNDRMKKGGSSNSIESGNSSGSSHKKLNSNEKLNKPGNGYGKIYENEIQEYPGQKFITFTPLEFNTFPATASVRVIPGQSKRDKVQRRSLAIEVQAPKETFIPIETKDHNYMQIENLRYKKQKRKEHQEYEDKIASWVNDSAIPPQSSQTKKI